MDREHSAARYASSSARTSPSSAKGIVRVLDEGGFEVVGTPRTPVSSLRMADAYRPDVVIADIQMPPDHSDDGLRAALAIRAAQPGMGVLVLSQFLEDAYALALVADGAQGVGYLLKEKVGDLRVFTDAVRRVAEGGSVLDPDVVARLVGRKRKAGPLDSLTPRERQVLALIAEGRSNGGIAQRTRRHRGRHRTARDQHLRQARAAPVARGAPPGARRAQVPEGLNRSPRSAMARSSFGTNAIGGALPEDLGGTCGESRGGQHDPGRRAGGGQLRRRRETVPPGKVDVEQYPVWALA